MADEYPGATLYVVHYFYNRIGVHNRSADLQFHVNSYEVTSLKDGHPITASGSLEDLLLDQKYSNFNHTSAMFYMDGKAGVQFMSNGSRETLAKFDLTDPDAWLLDVFNSVVKPQDYKVS